MPNIDLHCHSIVSDGLLPPAALVERAHLHGVDVLALTDHDELGGLAEARQRAGELGLNFVNGVEVSVTWGGITIHMVGLRIDPQNPVLAAGLASIRAGRLRRADAIAEGLSMAGIEDSLEGALRHAENSAIVGRTHFARFLVEAGYAPNVGEVFKRFLVKDKPGYVPHRWAELGEAVEWIHAAGGSAVIAHPGRYKLSAADMRQLLGEFRELGGEGVEVVTGSHTPQQYGQYAALAHEFGLAASRGSDFHGPGESRVELGKLPDLPAHLKPVWRDWGLDADTKPDGVAK
jgi:3',5'-nucleoside bisphosphate phosphatase